MKHAAAVGIREGTAHLVQETQGRLEVPAASPKGVLQAATPASEV